MPPKRRQQKISINSSNKKKQGSNVNKQITEELQNSIIHEDHGQSAAHITENHTEKTYEMNIQQKQKRNISIPTSALEEDDILNDELSSNASDCAVSNLTVTSKYNNKEHVRDAGNESENEEYQQQRAINTSNGDNSNESEHHDQVEHTTGNVLDKQINLYDQHQEEQQLMDTNDIHQDIDAISIQGNVYDYEDEDTEGQNQPAITDPFQFNFTNIKATRKLRPPTVIVRSSFQKKTTK
ncbi:unnamed protein product [Rotaria sordida]|uniref:Uncharacterized protein n=1 Tax=Rotaria sordida TaxID=392033 RepID=A0A815RDK6_9BILA|nr:unnamed protein product [Rotaria sordida]CAF1536369.1 unnamed protein product [Rotaria sordida]CAF3640585.1 unnamed protein product [Rotaria sordida]CAF4152592.1 unnamed protein product [Rotaria sordida]